MNNIYKCITFVLIFISSAFVTSNNLIDISFPNFKFIAIHLEDVYGNVSVVTIVPYVSNKIIKVTDKQRLIWNRTSCDEFLSELKLYKLYGDDRLLFIVSLIDNVKYVKFYIKQGWTWIETSMEEFNSAFEAMMKTRVFELRTVLDTDTFMIQRQIFSGIPAYVFTPYNIFDVVIVTHINQIIWSSSQRSDKCIRIIVHGDLNKPLLLNISILHDYKSLSSEKPYPGGRLTEQFDIMRMHLSNQFLRNVRRAKQLAKKSQKGQKNKHDETGTGTQHDDEQTSKEPNKTKASFASKHSEKGKGDKPNSQDTFEEFELVDQVETDQQKIRQRKIYYFKKKDLESEISKLKYQLFVTDDLLELEKKIDREDDEETSESGEDDEDYDYDDIYDKSKQPKDKSKSKKLKKIEKILGGKHEELARLESQIEKLNSLNLTGVSEMFNSASIKQNLLEKISALKFEIVKIEELLKIEKYIDDIEPGTDVESQDKKSDEKDHDEDKETSETDSSDDDEEEEEDDDDDYDDDGYERGGDSDDDSGGGSGNGVGESSNQNDVGNTGQYEDKSEETSTNHKKIKKIEKELILRRKKMKRLRRVLRSLEERRFMNGIKEYLELKEDIDKVNRKIERIQYSVFQFKEMIKILKKNSRVGSSKQLKEMRKEKIKELQKQSDKYSQQLGKLQKELEKLERENSGQIDAEELDRFIEKEIETRKEQVYERQRERLYKKLDLLNYAIQHFKDAIRIEKQHDDCNKPEIQYKIKKYQYLLKKKQKELEEVENDLIIVESNLQKSGTKLPGHHHPQPPEPVKGARKVERFDKGGPVLTVIPASINTNYFRAENIFQQADKPRQFSPRFTVPLSQIYSRLSGPYGQYQQYYPQQQNLSYHPRFQAPQSTQGSVDSSTELVPEIVTVEDSNESDNDSDGQQSYPQHQSATGFEQQNVQNYQPQQPAPQPKLFRPYLDEQHTPQQPTQQQYQPQLQPQPAEYQQRQQPQYQPQHPQQQSQLQHQHQPQQLQQPQIGQQFQIGPQPQFQYQPQLQQQQPQQFQHYQPYQPPPQSETGSQQQNVQSYQFYQPYTPIPQHEQPASRAPYQQPQRHFSPFGTFRPYGHRFQAQHRPTVQQTQEYPGESGSFIGYQHYQPQLQTGAYQPNIQQTDQPKDPEPAEETQPHLPLKKRIRLDNQPFKTGPQQTEQIGSDTCHKVQQQVGSSVFQPEMFASYSEDLSHEPQVLLGVQTGTTGQQPSYQQVSGPQTRIHSYTFPVPPTVPVPPFTPHNPQGVGNRGEPSGLPPVPPIEPYPHKSSGNSDPIEERYYKITKNGWVRIRKCQYVHLLNKYDYQKAMGYEPFDSDS